MQGATSTQTVRERERQSEQQKLHRIRQLVASVPIVFFAIFAVLWAIPATREWATGRDERNPVEIITFLAMGVACVLPLRLAARVWRLGHSAFITLFFIGFGAVAFIVAGDELAWGQVVVDLFRSGPEAAANSERGIHELRGLREHTEMFRFGLAVIAGLAIFITPTSRFRFLKATGELLPWIMVIGSVSLLDLIGDYAALNTSFIDFLIRASELTEMMIAVVVLLYVWERKHDMWFRIP
jgi:hypothetical protein